MPRKRKHDEVKQYTHDSQKRINNPPVGLVTAETDHLNGKKTYQFDPHLDPELQWAGKAEGLSFDVDTVSLHVHERIDPLTIIEAVRKKKEQQPLFHWFESKENNPPIREAIEFYKHSQGWSNRLIAGDSLLVMNSLLEKEGMAGKIQMIYIDPPYGIKYGSNFQPFVNKKEVRDGKDEDLTQEPEMIKAFRDTWELGIHSYLTYMLNRLILAKELLNESGSVFVQISDENIHHIKEILDEVFGAKNFCGIIAFQKTRGFFPKLLSSVYDFLVWYAKNKTEVKYRKLYRRRPAAMIKSGYTWIELPSGERRRLTSEELKGVISLPQGRRFQTSILVSAGASKEGSAPFEFQGRKYRPAHGTHWKTSHEGLQELAERGRLMAVKNTLTYIRYEDDFPFTEFNNVWSDTVRSTYAAKKLYVVQTSEKVISRVLLMTTDPGDLVLDPTCGSGTTAYVAEQWGRRWVTCDTSRVAITLAKQRLMTALFDYYELSHPKEGVSSGFNYEETRHITLGSIAHRELQLEETLFDRPIIDKLKKRVAGPFTVEAVPAQRVKSLDEIELSSHKADISISRSGETFRQNDWIVKLLSSGIRGKSGQVMEFARIEPLAGTRWIHADAETKEGKKVVISFGPEYAPLEQRQIELAIEEAQQLVPKPKIVIFASFEFDPEAAKGY